MFSGIWRRLSLGSKLAAFGSVLVVVTVFSLTVLYVQRERTNFRAELEEQANLLLDTLPLTIRDQLYRLEVDELVDVGRVLMRSDDVTTVKIYSADGVLLVDGDEPIFTQTPEALGEELLTYGLNDTYLDLQDDQLLAGRSIWLGNEVIGAVVIGLSTVELIEQINAVTLQSLVIAALTLITGVSSAFALAGQITRPIDELRSTAKAMTNGELASRSQVDTGDEIGELATAFNTMADAIQRREKDLRELNITLEQKVNERTEELRDRNIALLKATEDAVQAKVEAEEATRLKSQFLASMSHELRTPLNAIMGFSDLLVQGVYGDVSDQQQERLLRINRNAMALLDMINQLLDLSKIEAGHIEIKPEPFNLRAWANDVTTQLEGVVKTKDIDFKSTVDDTLPDRLMGDPLRLRQIVVNLIGNAVKFTEEGLVSLEITQAGPEAWSLIVKDTGIGIEPEALDYIFDEFRQVDGSTERKYGGTGLGLAIVHRLVDMMGGRISVESVVDEGSTFTVTLPQ